MSREVHVQFWERVGVKLPGATHLIITGTTKEMLENEVRPLVGQFLRDRGLQLSPEKTRVIHISEGFDFLGQNLRKYGDKLLIQPSKKNTHRFLEKVREATRHHGSVKQENLIRVLNPVIRGWANYHRHVAALRMFKKTRKEIWLCLWRWARRRHPKKSVQWVTKRYWQPLRRKWMFAADTGARTAKGETIWRRLTDPTDVKIRRHCKIRSAANPFDPQWHRYFQERAWIKRYGENPLPRKGNPS